MFKVCYVNNVRNQTRSINMGQSIYTNISINGAI